MQSINQSTNQNRDDRLKRKGKEERRREKRKGEGKRGKGKEKEGREREKGDGKLKKREGREERKKKEKRKKKEGKKVSQFFSLRIGSHKKLSKIFFWEKYDIFSLKAKGKGKKGEEGSNYEKGGKRGNLFLC